jgi:hypothetical protein
MLLTAILFSNKCYSFWILGIYLSYLCVCHVCAIYGIEYGPLCRNVTYLYHNLCFDFGHYKSWFIICLFWTFSLVIRSSCFDQIAWIKCWYSHFSAVGSSEQFTYLSKPQIFNYRIGKTITPTTRVLWKLSSIVYIWWIFSTH